MKIQQLSSLFLVAVCSLFSTYNVKSHNYQPQPYIIYTNKDLDSLYAPITLSASGIRNFLQHTFNKPEYAEEVVPNDFSHLVQLLEHAHRSCKKRSYAKSVIRLFMNKIKACSYINAYAFSDMLDEIAELLIPHTKPAYKTEDIAKIVFDLMYSSFTQDFSYFKQRPKAFLGNLSYKLVEQLNEYYIPDTSAGEIRSIIMRFLEIGLSKLVWHPGDREETWNSVKTIAERLAVFVENDVITDIEDLNDLFISLLERYIVFLDISSADLPVSFYQIVKGDIASESIFLLELEEQEEYLEPKVQGFIRALNSGEAKARAREFAHHVRH